MWRPSAGGDFYTGATFQLAAIATGTPGDEAMLARLHSAFMEQHASSEAMPQRMASPAAIRWAQLCMVGSSYLAALSPMRCRGTGLLLMPVQLRVIADTPSVQPLERAVMGPHDAQGLPVVGRSCVLDEARGAERGGDHRGGPAIASPRVALRLSPCCAAGCTGREMLAERQELGTCSGSVAALGSQRWRRPLSSGMHQARSRDGYASALASRLPGSSVPVFAVSVLTLGQAGSLQAFQRYSGLHGSTSPNLNHCVDRQGRHMRRSCGTRQWRRVRIEKDARAHISISGRSRSCRSACDGRHRPPVHSKAHHHL